MMASNNQIPMDVIITKILPKLPTKSLLRLKCVSKSFKTIISSSEFINLQLHHQSQYSSNPNDDILIISDYHSNNLNSLNLESPESSPAAKLTPPTPVQLLIGSCNGLLCFVTTNFTYLLFNPCTQSFQDITYHWSISPCSIFGFGYDHKNDDYKIVSAYIDNVIIYSVKDSSSRIVEKKGHEYSLRKHYWCNGRISRRGILIDNHLIHWIYRSSNEYRICCLNVCSEKWEEGDVNLPEYNNCGIYPDPILGVVDGCLSLLVRTSESVDMWVIKEYGNKGSWMKLFSVLHSNYVIPLSQHIPLARSKRSDLEILMVDHSNSKTRLVWYNFKDNTSKRIEVDGVTDKFNACMCTPTLVSVD